MRLAAEVATVAAGLPLCLFVVVKLAMWGDSLCMAIDNRRKVRRLVTVEREVYRLARILCAMDELPGGFSQYVQELSADDLRGRPDVRKQAARGKK